jgi:hypothetical protein
MRCRDPDRSGAFPPRGSWGPRGWIWKALTILFLAYVAGAVVLVAPLGHWHAPDVSGPDPVLSIVNHTDEELGIYMILEGRDGPLLARVPANGEGAVWACSNTVFVARSPDGRIVDRRRTPDDCGAAWVIDDPKARGS